MRKVLVLIVALLAQVTTFGQVINGLFYSYPKWSEELENRALNDFPAKVVVGCYYLEGKGVKKNAETAVKWFKEAISQPHDDIGRAYNNLGYCYEHGEGVEVNLKQAFDYYLLAAQNRDNNSYCNLAECYEEGKGTIQNFDKALKWYEKCIQNGTVEGRRKSQVRTGYILAFEKKEVEQGMQYLEAAGKNGSAAAYYYLGEIYHHGIGSVKVNYETALSYFKKSINTDQILPFVVTLIGDFYYNGKGTPQNRNKAKEMYQAASKRGDADAKKKLNELAF